MPDRPLGVHRGEPEENISCAYWHIEAATQYLTPVQLKASVERGHDSGPLSEALTVVREEIGHLKAALAREAA